MKKLLLLLALTFSAMSTVKIHADPPVPVCPPICDDDGTYLR